MTAGKFDARIERARLLERQYPFAAEGLRFYQRVAAFQRSLYSDSERAFANGSRPESGSPLRDPLDLSVLLPRFSEFLSLMEQIAPAPLAQAAQKLRKDGRPEWQRVLEDFWSGAAVRPPDPESAEDQSDAEPLERSLAWMFLQPYAESLAARSKPDSPDSAPLTCPLCGCKPVVGVLRPEGDGAKKSLVCMLCGHEWGFRRLYCPSCGEEKEPQMAFYSAPEIEHVRVDVCDTCRTYLKTVDLTKTGLADPVVDELATVPLDLWALEHGYHKLQINLLGV